MEIQGALYSWYTDQNPRNGLDLKLKLAVDHILLPRPKLYHWLVLTVN